MTLRAVLATVLLSLQLFAAETAARQGASLSATEARGDFRIMQSIFVQAHATAFSQVPAGPLPDLFPENTRIATGNFVRKVLSYYRGIHVDHTGLGFSPELIEKLGLKSALFPLPLKFFAGRAWFDCDYGSIRFGAELVSVNGMPLTEIINKINGVSSIINDKGDVDNFRLTESFPFLYYLVLGPTAKWELEIREGTSTRRITVDTADGSGEAFVARKSTQVPNYAEPVYMMFNDELKAAYLAINTFMPSGKQLDSIESWNNFLFAFHREAGYRKAENLVIDLRTNRGGVMLFSAAAATWFIDRKLEDQTRSSARSRMLPYRQYVKAINGMPATEQILRDTEKHLQTGFADKMTDGYFETRHSAARYLHLTPIEQAHRFRKIFILTSRATYSAAVNFARLVKLGNDTVQIVGEETGSPGDGHSAEILVTYHLPASGLLFEIPLVRVRFSPLLPGQIKGRGIMPDIKAIETADDFVKRRDTQLEAVSRIMQLTGKK